MEKGARYIFMSFIILAFWLTSCGQHVDDQPVPGSSYEMTGHVLLSPNYMDYFILSAESNVNKKWEVELISVGDNFATIKSLKTGQVYSAKTNECFVSEEFGVSGLQLVWLAKEKREIGLYRFSNNPKTSFTNHAKSTNSSDGKQEEIQSNFRTSHIRRGGL